MILNGDHFMLTDAHFAQCNSIVRTFFRFVFKSFFAQGASPICRAPLGWANNETILDGVPVVFSGGWKPRRRDDPHAPGDGAKTFPRTAKHVLVEDDGALTWILVHVRKKEGEKWRNQTILGAAFMGESEWIVFFVRVLPLLHGSLSIGERKRAEVKCVESFDLRCAISHFEWV